MQDTRTASRRAAALALLTAFVTLFAQVLVHRVVSAKLLNNYAFLVISLTMLGFAFSGVVLSAFRVSILKRRDDVMAFSAALFALTLLATCWGFYHAETSWGLSLARADFLETLARRLPLALPFALPFAFCGFILGILLSSPDLDSRRIYCFDLIGSGLGAFAVIPAIGWWGVESSLLLGCVLLLVGAFVLTRAGRGARGALALTLLATLAAGLQEDRFFQMRYPPGSALAQAQGPGAVVRIEQILWDAVARIELTRIPRMDPDRLEYPALVGSNREFLGRFRKMLTQNNYAFTFAVDYDGNRNSLKGIEETIYAAAYQARTVPNPRVLAIGVGGGFDVLTALAFDAREVTGVEVNAATLKILRETDRDYFRAWVDDPRVRLVLGEGRHHLATSTDTFDVLQLSGVDSYAGTPGAAHVFSESYLYTEQAMDLYLSRLSERGVLNLMRLEYRPPREMLRALVTAIGALRRAGASRPSDHIAMVAARNGGFTAMLVKKTPFLKEEVDRLNAWTSASPYFETAAAPGYTHAVQNFYQAVLKLDDPRAERHFAATYPFDVRPATDDRPFFFKFSYWNHLFSEDPVVKASAPVMEMSVLSLLALIGGAALVCIYVPLRLLSHSAQKVSGAFRHATYFAAAGVGYLAIEVALLQKFGLFLGHPNYALSVVLSALLLASGVGSLASPTLVRTLGGIRSISYALAIVLLAWKAAVFPLLAQGLALPYGLKVGIVFVLVLPIGLALGTFVPTGLERLKARSPELAPWAWGINGIFSVLAPVLAVAFSMTWGIDALMLAAIPIYMVAGWVLPAQEA